MRRALPLAFALVAGAAAAQDAPAFGTPEPWHIAGPFGRGLGVQLSPIVLDFLSVSGAGVAVGDDTPCDNPAVTPLLQAPFACLNGDGTSVSSAGMGLSVVGAPTADTRPYCSNGLDCASRTSRRTTTGDRWVTPTPPPEPSGDFWACWAGVLDSTAASNYLVSRFGGTNDVQVLSLNTGTTAGVNFTIQRASDNASVAASVSASVIVGAPQVYCATYQHVGEGTSTARVYVDGVLRTTKSDMPLPKTSTINYAFNAGSLGFNPTKGRTLFSAVGVGLPTDADMAAVSRAVLGTFTGSKGEALTLTRTTVSTCCRDDGTGCTVLPPGRACVAGGRLKVRPVVADLVAETENFGAVYWTKTTLTATQGDADCNPAPNGTWTAWKLTPTVGATDAGLSRTGLAFTSGVPYAWSVWMRKPDGSPSAPNIQLELFTNGGTAPVLDQWQRRSHVPTAPGTSGVPKVGGALTWVEADGPVCLWGANLTQSASLQEYCPAGAAPASCAGEQYAWATPSGMSGAEGCSRFCLTPAWGSAAPAGTFLGFTTAARWAYPVTTSLRMTDGTTSTILTPANYTDGVQQCFRSEWSVAGNFQRLVRESDSASATSAFAGYATQPTFGNLSPAAMPFSISQVKVGNKPGACAP